jgi:adenosylmethionine-8-amino-7-oxononanoate aminotransferase
MTLSTPALPRISHGEGLWLHDVNGKAYLDASGGPSVFSLGHAHPEINEAIRRQLERVAHGYRYTFGSEAMDELTERVARFCGGSLTRMVFVTGGSEAVESALKLALQTHYAEGNPGRSLFVARKRSWHGNTLGALSVSDYAERQAAFRGSLLPVVRIPAVNAYRPGDAASPEEVAARGVAELEQAIVEAGPEKIAAFIFEPVVGAAGGVVPAPPGYAKGVREVCDRHGVLMIADEVMCGAGRSGTWRALEQDGAEPDVMTVAKGLGGGYVPLGAAIYGDRVAAAIAASGGAPMTGHTFTGHTLACAAGAAVQRIVERDDLLANVRARGEELRAKLRAAFADVPEVGDVRGRGLFTGVEIVRDPATKEPFPAARGVHLRLRETAFANGLICYPNGGNVDGVNGDTCILSPAYTVTSGEIDEIVGRFDASLRQTLASL